MASAESMTLDIRVSRRGIRAPLVWQVGVCNRWLHKTRMAIDAAITVKPR